MGVCYSKAGWLGTSTENYTDCSGLSTSNSKSLIYESPRWSADTGDKGKLATLFYKRRRRNGGNPDLFTARLEGLLGGIHNLHMKHSPGDITFASFVGTPFVRNLETEGMDALARSYAISAAKASARNTFLLLQERDQSKTVEVYAPKIKIQTPDMKSIEIEVANEIIIVDQDDDEGELHDDNDYGNGDIEEESELENVEGVQLDFSEDDEIMILTEHDSSSAQGEDLSLSEFSSSAHEDIDLGALYKARMQKVEARSFFESCFPATGRWASVVNAARQSACLPRSHNTPARNKFTEGSETAAPPLHELLEFKIRHETPQEILSKLHLTNEPDYHRQLIYNVGRFSGSDRTCSDAGHVCVGCCVSRASGRYSDSETCSEVGHACIGCCGSREDLAIPVSIATPSQSAKSETCSSSVIQVSLEGIEDDVREQLFTVPMLTPTHGLRVSIPKRQEQAGPSNFCSTFEHPVMVEPSEQLDRVDSDLDAFFSFPTSPSAKDLEELGSGHIIEEMKSAKLEEEMGLRRFLHQPDYEAEEELEGPRNRAESPRGGNALSKGAFGSPFPVLGASGRTTRHVFDKRLKLFSLERANTAALAKKHATNANGVLTSSSDSHLETSPNSQLNRQWNTHELDENSSDLFEIQDMQPMPLRATTPGVNFSCLAAKKSLSCSSHAACGGSTDVGSSAPPCNSSEFKSSPSFCLPV